MKTSEYQDKAAMALISVGGLLLFYIASMGPMVKLVDKGSLPASSLAIYTPLGSLVDGTSVEKGLDWYLVKVWKVRRD